MDQVLKGEGLVVPLDRANFRPALEILPRRVCRFFGTTQIGGAFLPNCNLSKRARS
jgi:hypothetical protein